MIIRRKRLLQCELSVSDWLLVLRHWLIHCTTHWNLWSQICDMSFKVYQVVLHWMPGESEGCDANKKTKTTIMQAETCHTLFIHLCHFHSWKCGKNLWPSCLRMSFKLYSNTVCISNLTLAIDRCVSHYNPSPPSWIDDQKFQSLPDTNMSLPVCSFVSCKSS